MGWSLIQRSPTAWLNKIKKFQLALCSTEELQEIVIIKKLMAEPDLWKWVAYPKDEVSIEEERLCSMCPTPYIFAIAELLQTDISFVNANANHWTSVVENRMLIPWYEVDPGNSILHTFTSSSWLEMTSAINSLSYDTSSWLTVLGVKPWTFIQPLDWAIPAYDGENNRA